MDMPTMHNATAIAPPANIESGKMASMAMSMGDNSCKLSMLLNWHTTDACFLTSTFHIRSSFGFFAACLAAFLLVMSLEFIRRIQRRFDRYLRSRNEYLLRKGQYSVADDIEEELLAKDGGEGSFGTRWKLKINLAVVLEQLTRGLIHTAQFAVSYCIMLLFMYSNGYIITSILIGSLVGFSLFTRDTLIKETDIIGDHREKDCC